MRLEATELDTATQPLPADQIGRFSLHEAILNRLRDMIITGELQPGNKINEAQVCARLGVSRTPLREALKYLASEGLVELVPRRGAVVKKFTSKETRDMLEVIKSLEQLAAERACEVASDAGIANIRHMHDEMVAAYEHGDRLTYYKLNQSIHLAIVALADNAALSDVHAILQTRLKRIRFVGHEGPVKWAAAVGEHVEMMEALEMRDAKRLKEVIGRHLTEAWLRVRDVASL